LSDERRWNPDGYIANWVDTFNVVHNLMPHFLDKIELETGDTVLDLGTASGKWAIGFAMLGCEVVAVDNIPEMLERVRLNYPTLHRCIYLIEDDARTLKSIPEQSCNLIFSEGLYEHFLDIKEREKMVEVWASKLVHDGYCVIGVPLNNVADDEIRYETQFDLLDELKSFKIFPYFGGLTINFKKKGRGVIFVICFKEAPER
jgi:SAM-dependent methyltransferase